MYLLVSFVGLPSRLTSTAEGAQEMQKKYKNYRKFPKISPSKYSRTPLFQTRLIRSPHYFEGRSNSLGFTPMFSVIYYQLFRTRLIRIPRFFEGRSNSLGFIPMFSVIYYKLFRTRLFRIPCYFELIVLSLHLKSSPLFRTCQQQSTYIRAQLEMYCILFELVLRNY